MGQWEMTFANVGTLEATPGSRDALAAILCRRNQLLGEVGCVLYEVGTSEDEPDQVFVVELWISADAHQASLKLESVNKVIAEAMPLMTGQMSGSRFGIVGSPLRD